MPVIPRRTTAVLVLSLIFTFASSASAQAMDPELHEQFRAGKLRLEQSMFGSGVRGTAELKELYDQQKWEQLVTEVISKKFVVDTYYFYLGAAAEAMGYPEAAANYYDLAATTSKKCVNLQTFTDTCVGFKFPGDALKRKSQLAGVITGDSKSYALGEGPTVMELTGIAPLPIEELRRIDTQSSPQRGKFETEEEYQARLKRIPSGYLITLGLDTNDRTNCLSEYNHTALEYVVTKCVALSETVPIATRTFEGESIQLSNMMDRREIKRLVTETYYLTANFIWNQVIKLSREDARKLDDDLMVGAVIGDFSITSECPECESRKLREDLASIAKSAGTLSNRPASTADIDWKKDAFLKGQIAESWTYRVKPSKVVMYLVFRRSDNRVIYSFRPA